MSTRFKFRLFGIFAIFGLLAPSLQAGAPVAVVSHAVNDVTLAGAADPAHPVTPQEGVPDECSVITGLQSRAELTLKDQRLIRLGAETRLRFSSGSHQLQLDQGTLLVQIPRFHSGPSVHTGSLTASAGNAAFLIEHLPGKIVKIAVLEGEVRLSVDGFLGDSIVLTAGKLLITSPSVKHLPDPVDVDLLTLSKTSSLINPALFQADSSAISTPLKSMPVIEKKIAQQDHLFKSKVLFHTNLVILGSGNNVVIPSAAGSAAPAALPASAAPTPAATAPASASAGGVTASGSDPVAAPLAAPPLPMKANDSVSPAL